jgi:threonyl-tRNA synthetase
MAERITVTLPDGSEMEVAEGTTSLEVAEKIGPGLARDALAAEVNGEVTDLTRPLDEDCTLSIFTWDDDEGRDVYWHSTAHVMADAVMRVFPDARPTIGPAVEDGFYYDFEVDEPFTDEDLERIEEEMQAIIDADYGFSCETMPAAESAEYWEQQDNIYKVELASDVVAAEIDKDAPRGHDAIQEFADAHSTHFDAVEVSHYTHGEFTDLCRGPHLPSTGRIGAFKLTSVAGAYWRGSERNQMLQRIYGISFPKQKQLQEHIDRLEEAKKRDHRVLGRELELFTFFEEAGAGFPYYLPKGATLRQIVTDFSIEEHRRRGYEILRTPHLIKSDVWHTSGHAQQEYPMYYTEIEEQEYGIKPMNCPGHLLIYKTKTRSYRDLPLRFFELGTVYRHERSGVLHGLMRVRGFTQDDAHIFCTPEQLQDEIIGVIEFAGDMLEVFGFDEYDFYLSTRPEKYVGSDEQWERATEALEEAMDHEGLDYEIDEGGGAFYGPKIDVKVRDAIGREWQCATIQCDFTQPERFDITYVGEDGEEHRPVMIHRVVLAGIERFLGIVIENYAGAFPLWLAPLQVIILPIADRHDEYASDVADRLRQEGFRVEVDTDTSTLGAKIRNAEMQKYPYMLIVGDNEEESGQVSVRDREEGDLGPHDLDSFIETLHKQNEPGA